MTPSEEENIKWMEQHIRQKLNAVIRMADHTGFVITVDLVPTKPLRMGGYTMVPDIRPARVLAEPITEYERLENQHMGNPELKTGIYNKDES